MKFNVGDATDTAQCAALKHEFLRCEDSFRDFETYGALMIMKVQSEAQGKQTPTAHEKRLIAYKTYNSYSRFIHYLYEFTLGAIAREFGDTRRLKADVAERYIMGAYATDFNRKTQRHPEGNGTSMGKRHKHLPGERSAGFCWGLSQDEKQNIRACYARKIEHRFVRFLSEVSYVRSHALPERAWPLGAARPGISGLERNHKILRPHQEIRHTC
jgi:hypothetical protein